MKKTSYYPVYILAFSIILGVCALLLEFSKLQVKLFFIAKIGFVVGFIGLWLFTILPMMSNKKKSQ